MAAAADLRAALDAVRAVRGRAATASDDELLADLAEIEAVGRVVDGLRIAAAAEVERRSHKNLGEQALSFRRGARDAVELVADLTRVGPWEAKRRIGMGAAVAPRVSLGGDPLPSRFPELTAAIAAGEVGLDSARVIVEAAQHVRKRAAVEDVSAMVASLTEQAAAQSAALVVVAAHVWTVALDPDGPVPDESGRHRGRAFRLGRRYADGAVSFSGVIDPQDVATVREALQSRRRGRLLFRTEAGGGDSCEQIDPEWREDAPDPRSAVQQDYDTFRELIGAGLRAEEDGAASTTALHELVVVATADGIERRQGSGWAPGVLAGLPMPVVERVACTGGVRLLVTDSSGEPLHLSRTRRIFSPAQKKALLVAAGGACGIPGCTSGAAFPEAHHVEWWHRDTGPTDVENGIMLCAHHHAQVHAKHSPIRLRRWHGDVWIVPSGRVFGDPRPHERRQRGPSLRTRVA